MGIAKGEAPCRLVASRTKPGCEVASSLLHETWRSWAEKLVELAKARLAAKMKADRRMFEVLLEELFELNGAVGLFFASLPIPAH